MEKVGWGMGRREVIMLREEILELIAKGLTVAEIYRRLSDSLTLRQPTFRGHVADLRRGTLVALAPPISSQTSEHSPVTVKTAMGEQALAGGSFCGDPSASDEDLW